MILSEDKRAFHILIVEDDPAYLYFAQHIVEGLGHKVSSFANCSVAWGAVAPSVPLDLLLTDLRFPQGQPNGLALALRTRRIHPGVAVLFMTAHADLVSEVGNNVGSVLLKSLPPKEFGETVQAALQSKALGRHDAR